jgi:hypothetical protein
VIGGAALLAAWLVALALGALGGFVALPSLPGQSGGGSHEASTGEVAKPSPVTRRDNEDRSVEEGPVSDAGSSAPTSHPAPERAPRSKPTPAPAVSVTTATKPGKRLGITQTSGKPLGSPGNGPGGAGPPGQTR